MVYQVYIAIAKEEKEEKPKHENNKME